MKRRTEIIIETERLVLVTRGRTRKDHQWCAGCAEGVDMMTTDDAALIARVTSRTIFRWAESGRVHSSETPDGLLLICSNSLPKI
jgi:hypothetical protein